MKISFLTFPNGHLVSDREFDKLKKGFAKQGMELVRKYEKDANIVMVKGFSHTWNDISNYPQPKVYFSIGTEWKVGIDLIAANEPIYGLYTECDAVVHNSHYCQKITEKVFGDRSNQFVIIPANENNLPKVKKKLHSPVRCVSTAIWRPIKRGDDLKAIFKRLQKEGYHVTLDLFGTNEGPMLDDFSIYHDYDIYIQVSRKEGMPNTVLEALSYGLPCLVTNHGGAKEAVGRGGIIMHNDPDDDVVPDVGNIKSLDHNLFATCLDGLITGYEDYAQEVRDRVDNELNDEVTAKNFKSVFNYLLSGV